MYLHIVILGFHKPFNSQDKVNLLNSLQEFKSKLMDSGQFIEVIIKGHQYTYDHQIIIYKFYKSVDSCRTFHVLHSESSIRLLTRIMYPVAYFENELKLDLSSVPLTL